MRNPTTDAPTDPLTEPLTEPLTDALTVPDADPTGDSADAGRRGPSKALLTPTLACAVAALLLLAAGVIGVTKARPYFAERDRAEQSAAALATGKQLAVNFVTMDYRTFDAYGARVLSGASGAFRTDYAAKLAELKKVVVANQTHSSVKQVEAGLVSSDADSAQVIVGLVAPTSNTATPQAVDKTYRLRLDLQRTPGDNATWKVISLDFVG